MLITGGYYIKARAIQKSDIAHAAPCVREIWDWMLREANHKDTKVCKRGQLIRSYRDIQDGLCWYAGWRKMTYKKHDCENSMKWLKKATMVTAKKTTRGMLITIINYDKFQTPANYESHTETVKKTTRKLQTTDTINKNDKNDKKERMKEEDTSSNEEEQAQVTFGNDDINWVFTEFEQQFDYKSQGTAKQDRFMARHLLKNFTKEQITAMMRFCNTGKHPPRVGSVEKLWYKRGDIIAGLKTLKESHKVKIAFIS